MPALYRQSLNHARQAGAALVLLAMQGLPEAYAQIDLGRMIRQQLNQATRPDQATPRPSSLLPKGADAQQCTQAANWLASDVSTLPPEFADNGRFGTVPGRTQETRIVIKQPKTGPLGEVKPSGISRDNWLLEDSRFVPQFGKPYDQLSNAEITELQKIGLSCRMMGRTAGGVTVDMGVYTRVFAVGAFPTFVKGLQQIRATRQEVRDASTLLNSMPDSDEGYKTYEQIAANAPRLRGFMTASELDKFDAAMASANERVAKPALQRQAQQSIASAQGYDGLVTVSKLIAEMTEDSRSSPMQNDPTVKALTAKQNDIARELQRLEHARIDALGSGLVGLERGVAYSNEIEPRYRKYIRVGPINDLWQEFITKRHAMIETSRPELSRRIAQTWDEAGLKALVDKYIPFGLDQQTAAGTALLTSVTEQKDAIEKRRILGANKAEAPVKSNAVAKAATPAKTVQTKGAKAVAAVEQDEDDEEEPLAKGEPSESVMYDMVKLRFDRQAAKIAETSANCERGPSGNDVVGAMVCLGAMATKGMGGGEPVKITSFEKLGCGRASGKPGYVCDYMIGVSGGITSAMGPTMAAIYGSGGAAQARFLKTKKSWIVFFGEKN